MIIGERQPTVICVGLIRRGIIAHATPQIFRIARLALASSYGLVVFDATYFMAGNVSRMPILRLDGVRWLLRMFGCET